MISLRSRIHYAGRCGLESNMEYWQTTADVSQVHNYGNRVYPQRYQIDLRLVVDSPGGCAAILTWALTEG